MKIFFLSSIFLVFLGWVGCHGDVYVSYLGCENCPERCLSLDGKSGRCVTCLKDEHCQSPTSPTKKCTKTNLCVCGSDQDCSQRQFCNGEAGCVACFNDEHCKEKNPLIPVCFLNRCEECKPEQIRSCAPEGITLCKKGLQLCQGNVWGGCEGWLVCKPNEICVNESCVLDCKGETCAEGEKRCLSKEEEIPGRFEVCKKNKEGCPAWQQEEMCKTKEFCSKGACLPYICPSAECSMQEKKCEGENAFRVCQETAKGCLVLSPPIACPQGTQCFKTSGQCVLCNPQEKRSCYSGSPSSEGIGICKAGIQVCSSDGLKWEACQGEITPSREVCNGKDDDCDGVVDNGFVGIDSICSVGTGLCLAQGKLQCKLDGSGTECSAKENPSSSEVCDGKDNNCDGKIDETFPSLGQTCTLGQGECSAQGLFVCKADQTGVLCNAQPSAPQAEICDGKDNDCDGQTDETLARSCYSGSSTSKGVGECKEGIQTCISGQWSPCQGEILPLQEVCDGKDNDCDGQVDENLSRACYSGMPATKNIGSCKEGSQTCSGGQWGACQREILPSQEICGDSQDNDCNGKVDDAPSCCSSGKILELAGSSWVEIPTSKGTFQLQNALTVEAWAYVKSTPPYPGNPRVFSKGAVGSSYEDYSMQFCTNHCGNTNSPLPSFGLKDKNGGDQLLIAANATANQWVHVAATYNGTISILYVNGVQVQSLSVTGPLTATNTHNVLLGRSGGPYDQFTGYIDEIRLWNYARTPQQLTASMRTSLVGNEQGLVGYWNFDDGTAKDLSSSQNHGSLKGSANVIPMPTASWCP